MTEPLWRQVEPLAPGEYDATCVSAEAVLSAAGNACIRWTWEFPGGVRLASTTVRRRAETGLTAQALGLPKAFRLSAAAGRQARVTIGRDGPFRSITAVRPL